MNKEKKIKQLEDAIVEQALALENFIKEDKRWSDHITEGLSMFQRDMVKVAEGMDTTRGVLVALAFELGITEEKLLELVNKAEAHQAEAKREIVSDAVEEILNGLKENHVEH